MTKPAQFSGERTSFSGAQFNSERTSFSEAQFNGEGTSFSGAQFSGERTSFKGARFSGEWTYFFRAQFSGESTSFGLAQFSGESTSFGLAQFSGESTSFSWAQFSGERTSFEGAQFSGERTYFEGAQFSGERTSFSGARFSGERTFFARAQFSAESTSFSGAQFRSAETDFQEATFVKEVAFTGATFSEKASFWGSKANPVFGYGAWAWFNRCRIEKPEQFTFNTVLLHPGWFINVDMREVHFTNVKWYGMPGGPKGTLDEEIDALTKRDIESPHALLSQACRRLSTNAEENHEYALANEFHYWSMDAVRKESWDHFKGLTLESLAKKETWRDIRKHFGLVTTLYWALSGYGVRAGRALGVLGVVWAVFALLYMLLGPSELRVFSPEVWWLPSILAGFPAFVPTELDLFSVRSIAEGMTHIGQAMVYSLSTLARLNPKPKPDPGLFQALVTIEGILGPLQIALLALAVRRKVMR